MRAKLLNIKEFLYHSTSYRVVNFTGSYGTGKTLISVALAFEYWRLGIIDNIYTNFPMSGRKQVYQKHDTKYCMILDEAHQIVDSRSFAKNASEVWLDALRKKEAILLLPAVIDVDKRFRRLICQRSANLFNFIWIYRWLISDGIGRKEGSFFLVNPKYYFGSYSTKHTPSVQEWNNLKSVVEGDISMIEERRKSEENKKYHPVVVVEDTEYPKFTKKKEFDFFKEFIKNI